MSFIRTNGFVVIGSTTIHTTNISYNRGVNQQSVMSDGYASPSAVVSLGATPTVSFTTCDVASLLSVCGFIDNGITTIGPVAAYSQLTKNESVRESGATHTKYNCAAGMLSITTLGCEQGGIASASCVIYPTSSDGFTTGLATSTTSLGSFSPQVEVLTLGTVSLNGTALIGNTGFSLSTNNEIKQVVSDGNFYPTITTLMSHVPMVTVNSVNPNQIETLIGDKALNLNGTTGLQITLTSTVNGVAVATVAKTIQIKNGQVRMNEISMSNGAVLTSGFTVMAKWDHANAVIIVS